MLAFVCSLLLLFERVSAVQIESSSVVKIRLDATHALLVNRHLVQHGDANMESAIVYELLGVPYAQAPLGDRRFQFPFNLTRKLPTDLYDATYSRDSCMQNTYDASADLNGNNFASRIWMPPGNVSEDCLYMNVFAPVSRERDHILLTSTNPQTGVDSNLTTMVWIYGGAFNSGTNSLDIYNGVIMAALENVILVAPNYRLGLFGFLYLESDLAPGNAGLADISLAIEWYKDHYAPLFTSSTSNVVLFGESAGAMAIHDLILSEKSHLFSRAILQSASSYLDLSFRLPNDALKLSYELAESIGCLPSWSISFNDSCPQSWPWRAQKCYDQASDFNELIRECLLSQTAEELVGSQNNIKNVARYLSMEFVPTLDFKQLLRIVPTRFEIGKETRARDKLDKDIMTGFVNDEGSCYAYLTFYNETYFANSSVFSSLFNYSLRFISDRLYEALFEKDKAATSESDALKNLASCLARAYLSGDEESSLSADKAWMVISKVIGDFGFACPALRLHDEFKLRNASRAFLFRFNQRASTSQWPDWMGVTHGDEIEFLFGLSLVRASYSDQDRQVSAKMMNYWTNFAKHGKLISRYESQQPDSFLDFSSHAQQEDERDRLKALREQYSNCELLRNDIDIKCEQFIQALSERLDQSGSGNENAASGEKIEAKIKELNTAREAMIGKLSEHERECLQADCKSVTNEFTEKFAELVKKLGRGLVSAQESMANLRVLVSQMQHRLLLKRTYFLKENVHCLNECQQLHASSLDQMNLDYLFILECFIDSISLELIKKDKYDASFNEYEDKFRMMEYLSYKNDDAVVRREYKRVLNESVMVALNFSHVYRKLDLTNNLIELKRDSLTNIFSGIVNLDLNRMNITTVESNTFELFKSLKVVKMCFNQFDKIPARTFWPLDQLKELHLDGNQLTTIDSELLQNSINLEQLFVSKNQIEQIAFDAFKSLKKLKQLNMSQNSLSALDERLFIGLKSLEKIDLSKNNLSNLGDLFDELTNLEELRLGDNKLSKLEGRNLKYLISLKELELRNNDIKVIDSKAFQRMYKLEILQMRGNKISRLNPMLFANMINLKSLDLSYNSLVAIENAQDPFANQYKLEYLNLSFNQLEYLGSNLLRSMGRLATLILNNNRLRRFDSGMFKSCFRLKFLYLNHNQIDYLPFGIFANMNMLNTLNLANNSLEYLDDYLFCSLYGLEYLDIGFNKLRTINADSLHNLDDLICLFLNDNQISRIDSYELEMLKGFEKLKHLKLRGNPIESYFPSNVNTVR